MGGDLANDGLVFRGTRPQHRHVKDVHGASPGSEDQLAGVGCEGRLEARLWPLESGPLKLAGFCVEHALAEETDVGRDLAGFTGCGEHQIPV